MAWRSVARRVLLCFVVFWRGVFWRGVLWRGAAGHGAASDLVEALPESHIVLLLVTTIHHLRRLGTTLGRGLGLSFDLPFGLAVLGTIEQVLLLDG